MRCGIRLSLAVLLLVLCSARADAATTCVFETTDTRWTLTGDCSTDTSIVIPDGITFDGATFTITAFDPAGGSFEGGILVNGGSSASVINTRLTAVLGNVACHAGTHRLRGIFFDGAAGIIRDNRLEGINQGGSPCNEGNAIEVRSLGHIVAVEIEGNVIADFQKSGVVLSGDVDAWIHDNRISASATQAMLAANGVQVGFGAKATIERNEIAGNSWTVDANWAATAVLLIGSAPGTVVRDNDIEGNADIGIHVQADGATIEGNRLFETGPDGFYDVGIGNYGRGNVVTGNKIRGYSNSYDGSESNGGGILRIAARYPSR